MLSTLILAAALATQCPGGRCPVQVQRYQVQRPTRIVQVQPTAPSDSWYANGYYWRRDRFGTSHYGTDWLSVWRAAENATQAVQVAPVQASTCYINAYGQRVCPR